MGPRKQSNLVPSQLTTRSVWRGSQNLTQKLERLRAKLEHEIDALRNERNTLQGDVEKQKAYSDALEEIGSLEMSLELAWIPIGTIHLKFGRFPGPRRARQL